MALVHLLCQSSVKEVPRPTNGVVTLKSTENPRDAYKRLADANIRSAPVFDVKEGRYVGFLDVRDLIAFIVYENSEGEALRKVPGLHGTTEFIDRMLTAGARMYDQPIESVSVSYLARRRNFHCVPETATLDDVAKLLVHKGCHRVPVVDDTGEIVNIISQSSIIKYLDAHKAELGAIGAHTVARSACGTSPVLSVKDTDSIFDALQIMATNDIMGVAVVDDGGNLIANTSASDLKEFLRDPSTSLGLTAIEFVAKVRQQDLHTMHPSIRCKPTDTLAHIIGRLAAAHVHRLYVVDGGKLQSVISLTDILRYAYLVSLIKGDD